MLCWFWSRSFCGAFEKNADCEPTDLEMLFGVMCGTRCNPGTGNKNWRNGWGRYHISLVPIPTYIPKITNIVRVLTYSQVYNIRRTKYQHLQDFRTASRLPLPNPLKPDVKSRMKMHSYYIWVIDNFIAYYVRLKLKVLWYFALFL